MNAAFDTVQICACLLEDLEYRYTYKDIARLDIFANVTDMRVMAGRWSAYHHLFKTVLVLLHSPSLKTVDVLVNDLVDWTDFSERLPWCAGFGPHVRIVSCATGEWMDDSNCGIYADWLDTGWGIDFTRVVSEEVETLEEKKRDVAEFTGLSRTGLNYWSEASKDGELQHSVWRTRTEDSCL